MTNKETFTEKITETQDNWVKIINNDTQIVVSSPKTTISEVCKLASDLAIKHSTNKKERSYII